MSWDDERVQRLKDMWGNGDAASLIARELGVTRNAVIGKAHRLGLSSRPSPIRRTADGVNVKETPKVITILDLTERTCRWPLGDPLKPGFSFCGKAINHGQSYCAQHAAIAFQQSGPRREDRNASAAQARVAAAAAAAAALSPPPELVAGAAKGEDAAE